VVVQTACAGVPGFPNTWIAIALYEWTVRLGKPQLGWKWDILTGRGLHPSKRWLERPKCQAKKGAESSGRAWLILACLAVFQPLDFSPAGRIAIHIQ
jgi:hypothetical protein